MHKIFGAFFTGRAALGLLVIRIFFGLALVIHGYGKAAGGAFHWADKMPGAPAPFLQGLATLSELGGGLAMIFGLLTPLAMLGIIITMAVAIVKVHLPQGAHYVSLNHGTPSYETAAHYLIVAAGLLISGPGAFSLDALIFGRRLQSNAYAP